MERELIEEVADRMANEVEALRAVLPVALAVRYEPAPIARLFESERGSRSGVPDPTADVALDERRLALSEQLTKSVGLLNAALVNVIGVRRGIERTLNAWEGLNEE
jgi:hypothetical protein